MLWYTRWIYRAQYKAHKHANVTQNSVRSNYDRYTCIVDANFFNIFYTFYCFWGFFCSSSLAKKRTVSRPSRNHVIVGTSIHFTIPTFRSLTAVCRKTAWRRTLTPKRDWQKGRARSTNTHALNAMLCKKVHLCNTSPTSPHASQSIDSLYNLYTNLGT